MDSSAHKRSLFWVLLGAVLISFAPILVRVSEVAPTASAFYRMLIGGGVLLVFLIVKRRLYWPTTPVVFALVLAGACFAVDLFFWHRSIQLIGPGLATLLAGFQVFFMAIAARLFFLEAITWRGVVGILLAFVGLALIVSPGVTMGLGLEFRHGVVFGLLTALAFAGVLLCLAWRKTMQDQADSVFDILIVSLVAAVFLGLICVINQESLSLPSRFELYVLLAYALIAQIGWVMVNQGMGVVATTLVALILLLEPILAMLWDNLIFKTQHSPTQLLGAFVALVAMYVVSKNVRRS